MDRGHEVALLNGHSEIDRIEVDLAAKAATEIRARVDRGMTLVATGAQEDQLPLTEFVRPFQLLQDGYPRDIVA